MNIEDIRPMLAHSAPVDPKTLPIPPEGVWVSPKLDGIRCLQVNGVSMSRKLKPLPNTWVQYNLNHELLNGLDGEVVVGSPTDPNCIQNTTSGVMSHGGEPDFMYHVFDCWHTPSIGFRQRYGFIKRRVHKLKGMGVPVVLVPQILVHTNEQLDEAVGSYYEAGYEGAIVRSFDGRYKYNRSTLKEGLLLKVKESIDSEIRITGFVEMEHNNNAATVDALGLTKRSTHKANKTAAGTLGKILGVDVHTNMPLVIGTGKMSADLKLYVWQHQDEFMDRLAKYRFAKHGIKDKPRFPRWIAWRDSIDM